MKPIDCVIPLWGADADEQPELIGSAVLLLDKGKIYLITATHVFTANPETTIYYPGKQKLEILTGERVGYSSDEEDISVMLLENSIIDTLHTEYSALPSELVDLTDSTNEGDVYAFAGFPEVMHETDLAIMKVNPKRLLIQLAASHDKKYRQCQYTQESHIIVNQSSSKVKDADGQIIRPPELHCMSGGGVWKTGTTPGSLRLVGITIEKHHRIAALVAVRINYAIEIIRNHI